MTNSDYVVHHTYHPCTWCIHRDYVCIHTGSPVYPNECNPWHTGAVCIGQVRCQLR